MISDTAAPTNEAKIHIVKKGEILSDISRKYYGSSKNWRKIADANHVKEDGLKEGMKLTIPALEVAPVTTEPTTGDAGTYVVKKGDSYYKIAKKELGDASRYKEIEKLNGVAAEDLHEGQKIKLPAKSGAGSDTALPGPGPELPAGSRTHVVAEGEYLSDISKKYYGSTKHWQEIVKANPGVSPEHLKVGQKLVIPEVAGKSAVAPGTTPEITAAADEYVVKKGDTFEVIASKTLGDKKQWKKIQDVNPGVDPSALKIGQKVKLPAGAKGSELPSIPAPSPQPMLPSPAFPPAHSTPSTHSSTVPASGNPFPGSSTSAPSTGTSIPGPSDPWAPTPLPSSSTSGTGASTSPSGTGTSTPAQDPWQGFPTTSAPASGTGTPKR